MYVRAVFAVLLWLIAVIRGYYMLRFGFRPMRTQKPREWFDWAAEIGAYAVALDGALYVLLGPQMPLRFGDAMGLSTAGLAVFALGVALFGLSHRALAKQWSWHIGLRDNHQVVRRGLYRFIRHPMYTAIGAWLIGAALVTQSWLGLLPLVGLPGLYLRARAEEALLVKTFGPEYAGYLARTGMFMPHFKLPVFRF